MAAVALGAVISFGAKGTRRHRRLGWAYVLAMVGLNVTALLIYKLSGRFGPFHVAAVFSLGTVAAGTATALRRRARWIERHYYWMSYSYVGLIAAAVAEVTTRLPVPVPFWWAVVVPSAVVLAGGAAVVSRSARRSLAPFRR